MIAFEDMFDVSAEEEAGKISKLHRRCRVTGLAGTDAASYAAELFTSSGVPRGGIRINFTYLTLKRRTMQVGSESALGTVHLDLYYERSSGTDSEDLRRGGRVSARQVRTKRKRNGEPITVSYTNSDSVTDTQIVELSVLVPTAEPYIETLETTYEPEKLALSWVGTVNSDSWRSMPAGRWLCVDASYEAVNVNDAPPKWRFNWAFQLSEDESGWLPAKVYVDPNTSRTPVDVTNGNGMETEPYYSTSVFGAKF